MKGALEFGSLWSAEGYNGDCLGCHIQRADPQGPKGTNYNYLSSTVMTQDSNVILNM